MANIYWTGGAPASFDVWDLALALTWASGDTARITLGNKDLLVVVGSSTLATIATELIASINAATALSPAPPANFSRNVGGQQIPEFTDVIASAHPTDTSKVRLTATREGVPMGVTAGETTAGSGTLTAANTVVASGPNFANNPDNYLGGALPLDNDKVIADRGATSIQYALDFFRAGSIDCDWLITGDFTGDMGLPPVNLAKGYPEYRNRYLQMRAIDKTVTVDPGLLASNTQGRLWLDFQDQTGTFIRINASRGSTTEPRIFLAGADASTLDMNLKIQAGGVAIEPDDAPTGATKYAGYQVLVIGSPGGDAPVVTFGRNARISGADGLTISSGNVVANCNVPANIFVYAGSLTLKDGTQATGAIQVFKPGSLYLWGYVCVQVTLFGGVLDCNSGQPSDIDKVVAYGGSTIKDSRGNAFASFHAVGCRLSDLVLDLAANREWDLAGTATP